MNNNNNKGYFIHNSNAKPLNECIKVVCSRLLALFDLTKNSVSLYSPASPTTHLLKSRTINSAGTK